MLLPAQIAIVAAKYALDIHLFFEGVAAIRQRLGSSEARRRRELRQVHGEAFEIGERTVN
jgi:hypothetical protein